MHWMEVVMTCNRKKWVKKIFVVGKEGTIVREWRSKYSWDDCAGQL